MQSARAGCGSAGKGWPVVVGVGVPGRSLGFGGGGRAEGGGSGGLWCAAVELEEVVGGRDQVDFGLNGRLATSEDAGDSA